MKIHTTISFLSLISIHFLTFAVHSERSLTLETTYGSYIITEPLIIDLIEHPMMQRLKEVHQYGFNYYLDRPLNYTRYDHSIGVFVLLRRYGASELEQIAGLLHDASHTAGSHIADFIFKTKGTNSYQDDHHEEFLRLSGIADTLARYGVSIDSIHHKNKHFCMLEQELPEICADRLEYNLAGGILEGLLSEQDIPLILAHLRYENNRWIFTDPNIAHLFAQCPLYMTEHVWTSPKSFIINTLLSNILEDALQEGVISLNNLLFGTDDIIWHSMRETNSPLIKNQMHNLMHRKENFYISNEQDYNIFAQSKFRGIDPWVEQGTSVHRLSDINPVFKSEFERVKTLMKQGWYIKYQ